MAKEAYAARRPPHVYACSGVVVISLVLASFASVSASDRICLTEAEIEATVVARGGKPAHVVGKPTFTNVVSSEQGFDARWATVSGATPYQIAYRTDSQDWTFKWTTTHRHTTRGLIAGAEYYLFVRAYNANGVGSWSDLATVIPTLLATPTPVPTSTPTPTATPTPTPTPPLATPTPITGMLSCPHRVNGTVSDNRMVVENIARNMEATFVVGYSARRPAVSQFQYVNFPPNEAGELSAWLGSRSTSAGLDA